ncbi:MAG: hypothetical protein N3A59_08670 [Thermodesulfovibrionales bacterium]|nr:hypothetical protein [Thermodesulfovibrionales bacterium]
MVTQIPEGVSTMKDRFVIINKNAKVYQRASKKIKSQMLTELSEILHINRQYIAFLLRKSQNVVIRKGKIVVVTDSTLKELLKRNRKKVYGKYEQRVLIKIYQLTGFASSKHLLGFFKDVSLYSRKAFKALQRPTEDKDAIQG